MTRVLVVFGLLVIGGCVSLPLPEGDRGTPLVSNNPFGMEAPPPAPTKAAYAPAKQEIATQVDKIGKELLCANPQLAVRPLFATIGVDQLEIFHVETSLVYVTEGLVKQCRSNAELAAVLASELGKMVADREARTSVEVRNPDKMPPIQLAAGSGVPGRESDLTALAELGRFEATNPRSSSRTLPRPDPRKLARNMLEKAGYQATDLDTVNPLLQAAEKNVALERHIKGALPQSPWTP